MTDDDLDVPEFLRVSKAEGARRAAWNEAHPVETTGFSGETTAKRREVDEARARIDAERKESERQRLQALKERKREEARAETCGQYSKRMPGMTWNSMVGKWMTPNHISPANHARILSEMPTDEHRSIFIKLYGPGQKAVPAQAVSAGASAGVGGSPTGATSHAGPGHSARTQSGGSKAKRSRPTATGRVRIPSGPTTRAGMDVKKVKPARVPSKPRAAKTPTWMPGVIEMLGRPEGATLTQIGVVYGWQEHTASARLSAIRVERTILSAVENGVRVYRLENAA